MTIERYRMVRDPWNHAHMTARDDGEFVLHEDHLALVAAAYRDAAEQLAGIAEALKPIAEMRAVDKDKCEAVIALYESMAKTTRARTPADAEAHLTALLRAEYERGVSEAAKACDWGDIYGNNAVRCILALLTQEGR